VVEVWATERDSVVDVVWVGSKSVWAATSPYKANWSSIVELKDYPLWVKTSFRKIYLMLTSIK
jgi:hypothetical protein